MNKISKLLLVFLLAFSNIYAVETIHIKYSNQDMTYTVRQAIENAKEKDIELIFEKGDYTFLTDYAVGKYLYVTNHGNGFKKIIFNFEGFNSVVINGNNSKFVFRGQTAPFVFEGCKKIEVKNVKLDWDIPFSFQGDVVAVNKEEHWYELKPYTKGFSWKLVKGRIEFPGINNFNFSSLGSSLPHNKKTKAVAYGAWDSSLKSNFVEEKADGVLRFYQYNLKKFPRVGSVLQSKGDKKNNRYAPAFLARNSKDIIFNNVVIHHALGMGFLFERSENIKIINSGIYIEEDSDRVMSIVADATHFANCKGDILIENCRFEGMYDDGTNVHGTYVEVNKILDTKTVRVALKHNQQYGFKFAGVGDEVWFIKAPSPARKEINTVTAVKVINDHYTDLTFKNDIATDLKIGDILENKTWNPSFTMRGNTIQDHRARNIIIKTPKKIVIENNNLSSMMSSIMLRGETFYWFESGNVEDVIIRNNYFVDCAYAGSEHAILKVSPRLGKTFSATNLYDRNIVFENNTIETFGNRIIWADRVDGLKISKNTIKQTTTFKPQFPNAYLFDLINCNNVEIDNNTYNGTVTNGIQADKTSQKTLKVKKNKGFKYEK
ncbi:MULTISPECIES: right-handed parallel beta-helix repeat-containing protein [unclassified Cellulophaga]|uniref:right-handed parallel beta-helix repeat-containing protein n=1 Tax=unclassified Cellulophaga TaxID=2634405 RepID=UPI0026E190F1|nr:MULTISPECIES: right-handed parallel beta-helix repeat-containing protein [unclassified Cellulophaga]MDO6492387.1 right-handed parallel beta-helix repeat-containing protein [Cellulophaga sp. 2_MG-2023]MDO6496113.1 right-handed parallel beta-helix repeat-containing protein [Cellulophaga sp. 3_MG-2023]